MNVFDYAMKMEQDGRDFYLQHAERAPRPELKKILLDLADDEQKHYNLFKAMRDGHVAEYKESEKTQVLATLKNVFETLKSTGEQYSFGEEAKRVWTEAREIEKKAEAFYREQAAGLNDPNQKKILNRIADEEHHHWVTMHNVIQFLDRPSHWLEDAEWSHIEEY